MKYDLILRSWAKNGETIAQKHHALFAELAAIPPPWGIKGHVPPDVPDPGAHLGCGVSISKLLGTGIRGQVYYEFRRTFTGIDRSEDSFADFLDMSFNPGRVDYKQLVRNVLPRLIVAFDAYIAKVGDQEFTHCDFDAVRQQPWEGDRRLFAYRIYPVFFLEQSLCERNFALTPTQIVDRLEGKAERVSLLNKGVYIVGSSEPLLLDDADKLCWRIKKEITSK